MPSNHNNHLVSPPDPFLNQSLHNFYYQHNSTVFTNLVSPESAPPVFTPKKRKTVKKADEEKTYNLLVREIYPLNKVPPEKEIGLEIECEGTDLYKTPIQWWTTHVDHSLRPYKGHAPTEYVLKDPVTRQELTQALKYLTTKLKFANAYVHLSPRTSVHVHLNCQHLTLKQVFTIVCLYLTLEEVLVNWCGPEREGNLFCLRAKDAWYFVKIVEMCLRQDSYHDLKKDDVRYTSCNMAALSKYGTLEFRALRGTTDQNLIETWVDILLTIKSNALTLDNPKSVVDLFDKYGPIGFLEAVLTPSQVALFSNTSLLSNKLWDGIRLVKEIAFAVEWQQATPKKARTKKINESESGPEPEEISSLHEDQPDFDEEPLEWAPPLDVED